MRLPSLPGSKSVTSLDLHAFIANPSMNAGMNVALSSQPDYLGNLNPGSSAMDLARYSLVNKGKSRLASDTNVRMTSPFSSNLSLYDSSSSQLGLQGFHALRSGSSLTQLAQDQEEIERSERELQRRKEALLGTLENFDDGNH